MENRKQTSGKTIPKRTGSTGISRNAAKVTQAAFGITPKLVKENDVTSKLKGKK